MSETPTRTWNTHEAKDKLSKLLADAQTEEQIILRYGKPFAVVISYDDYLAKRTDEISTWDIFKKIKGEETLELPERSEVMRDVEL